MRKTLLIIISLFLITNPLFAGGNRWTSKPPVGSQIDWSHPLSRGLVGCWLMNEGGGNIIQDLSSLKNTGTNVGGDWVGVNRGIGLNFNGSSDYVDVGKMKNVGTNLDTNYFILSCWIKSLNTTSIMALCGTINDGFTVLIQIQLNTDPSTETASAGEMLVSRRDVNNDLRSGGVNSNTGITDGDYHHLVVSIPANSSPSIWIDRIPQTVADVSTLNADNMDNFQYPMVIGARNIRGTINRFFDGKMENVFMWSRPTALSPSEITQLYQEPYCFIKPPTIWSMFSTAVAAARRFFIFD